jgi:hypothetical protein
MSVDPTSRAWKASGRKVTFSLVSLGIRAHVPLGHIALWAFGPFSPWAECHTGPLDQHLGCAPHRLKIILKRRGVIKRRTNGLG